MKQDDEIQLSRRAKFNQFLFIGSLIFVIIQVGIWVIGKVWP